MLDSEPVSSVRNELTRLRVAVDGM